MISLGVAAAIVIVSDSPPLFVGATVLYVMNETRKGSATS